MNLTRIDLNTWILEMAGKTILIDPWLVDPLVFYGFPWLFKAYHAQPPRYTPETLPPIDLILLSQGLDDHCHKPTLERLDRQIPVIASPAAAKVIQSLNFTKVTVLAHGEKMQIDSLEITALQGASVQPGQVENGFLLRNQHTNCRVYYEPHLSPVELQASGQLAHVDVVIAPVIGQVFPLLGQVIMGPQQAMELVQTLQPQIFVPTSLGEVIQSGILPMLIQSVGSVSEFKTLLDQSGLPTQLLVPSPGETLDLASVEAA